MEVRLESLRWTGASPRISFSHDVDLPQTDASESTDADRRLDVSLPLEVSAPSDFDFSLAIDALSHDHSLADDLFSDGKLLPLPIKNPPSSSRPSAPVAAPPATATCRRSRDSLREMMTGPEANGIGRASPPTPFWRFRRSSSVGYGSSRSSLCPFPLLRSKSSGSSSTQRPNAKPGITDNSYSSAGIGKGSSRPFSELFRKGANEPKTKVYYYSGNSRRSYGSNAVRISPILNVPTPGSGSIFDYLLCKRGDKSMSKSSAVTSYP
ncbi:unnamed protein product [Musa acuminata subsp. malaccensis]|uniref:(wild Malaysian banana) hypothetical protein n=1 Tax=Musa acuminata subsp. malaccensis TaxID=214687 RepID=A0A804KY61_MUSAM|nr:PREDICTED: uncharacterized protein LOC103968714 [Musa acuminata subsp. malaccensis]CAG1854048.1 unnamed protein product [Musa acuminata subsp. malaccensis]